MIASAHLAVGAATGFGIYSYKKAGVLKRFILCFVAALGTHLLLDAFPHSEYGVTGYSLGAVLSFEILLVLIASFDLRRGLDISLAILLGMFGAALPDMLELYYEYIVQGETIGTIGRMLHTFHASLPIEYTIDIWIQVIIALAAVLFVRLKSVK